MSEDAQSEPDVPIDWTEDGRAFLLALESACRAEGFVAPDPSFIVGATWEAVLELEGPLGSFTLRLHCSWASIHHEDRLSLLTLAIRHGGHIAEDFVPAYQCQGVEGFLEELAYLRLIVRHTNRLRGLIYAMKCGADQKWRVHHRPTFMALLRHREKESGAPVTSKPPVLA